MSSFVLSSSAEKKIKSKVKKRIFTTMQPNKELSSESEKPPTVSWFVPPTTLRIGEISPGANFSRPVQSNQNSKTKIWRIPSHRESFKTSQKVEQELPEIGKTQLMKSNLPIGGNYRNNFSTNQNPEKCNDYANEDIFTHFNHEKEYPSALHSMKELLKMIDAVHQEKLQTGVLHLQGRFDPGIRKSPVLPLTTKKCPTEMRNESVSIEILQKGKVVHEVISPSCDSASGSLSKVAKKKGKRSEGKGGRVNSKIFVNSIRETINLNKNPPNLPAKCSLETSEVKGKESKKLIEAASYSTKPLQENLPRLPELEKNPINAEITPESPKKFTKRTETKMQTEEKSDKMSNDNSKNEAPSEQNSVLKETGTTHIETAAFEVKKKVESAVSPVLLPRGSLRKEMQSIDVFREESVGKKTNLLLDPINIGRKSISPLQFSDRLGTGVKKSEPNKCDDQATRGSESLPKYSRYKIQKNNKPITIVSATQTRVSTHATSTEEERKNKITKSAGINKKSTSLKPVAYDAASKKAKITNFSDPNKKQLSMDEQIEMILRLQSPPKSVSPNSFRTEEPLGENLKKEVAMKEHTESMKSPQKNLQCEFEASESELKPSSENNRRIIAKAKIGVTPVKTEISDEKKSKHTYSAVEIDRKTSVDTSIKGKLSVNEEPNQVTTKFSIKPTIKTKIEAQSTTIKTAVTYREDTFDLKNQNFPQLKQNVKEKTSIGITKIITNEVSKSEFENNQEEKSEKSKMFRNKCDFQTSKVSARQNAQPKILQKNLTKDLEQNMGENYPEKFQQTSSSKKDNSMKSKNFPSKREDNPTNPLSKITRKEDREDTGYDRIKKLAENTTFEDISGDFSGTKTAIQEVKPEKLNSVSSQTIPKKVEPAKKEPKFTEREEIQEENYSIGSISEVILDMIPVGQTSRKEEEDKKFEKVEEPPQKNMAGFESKVIEKSDPQKQTFEKYSSKKNVIGETKPEDGLVNENENLPQPKMNKNFGSENCTRQSDNKFLTLQQQKTKDKIQPPESGETLDSTSEKFPVSRTHSMVFKYDFETLEQEIKPSQPAQQATTGDNVIEQRIISVGIGNISSKIVTEFNDTKSNAKEKPQRQISTRKGSDLKGVEENASEVLLKNEKEMEKLGKSKTNDLGNQIFELNKTETKIIKNQCENKENGTRVKGGKELKEDKRRTSNLSRQTSASEEPKLLENGTENNRPKSEKQKRTLSPTLLRGTKMSEKRSNVKKSTFEKSFVYDERSINSATSQSAISRKDREQYRTSARMVSETQKKSNNNLNSEVSETSKIDNEVDDTPKKKSFLDIIGALWMSDRRKSSINTITEETEEEETKKNEKLSSMAQKIPAQPAQYQQLLSASEKETGEERRENMEKARKTELKISLRKLSTEKPKQPPPLTTSKGKPLWAPSSNQREQNVLLKTSMGIELTPKENAEVKGKVVEPVKLTTNNLTESNENVTTSKQVPKNKNTDNSAFQKQEKEDANVSLLHPNMMKMETKIQKPEKSLWEKLKTSLFGEMENDSGDESDLVLDEPSEKSKGGQLKSKCNVLHIMQPLNLKEEKEKFFKSDFKYDPQFTYSQKLTTELVQKYNIASSKYLEIAEKILRNFLEQCGSYEKYQEELLGKPLTRHEIITYVDEYCVREGLRSNGIMINISEDLISTASMGKIRSYGVLSLRLGDIYAGTIEGVLRHELGTHYVRRLNNNLQPWADDQERSRYKMLPPNPTEEGLASLNSLVGKPKPYILKAALLYYTVAISYVMSFQEVFMSLGPFVKDPNRRWDFCVRAKRGQTDTSLPGCFSKDQVYLTGILEILRERKTIDFKALMQLGKVAHEDVNRLTKYGNKEEVFMVPSFMHDQKEYQRQLDHILHHNGLRDVDFKKFPSSTNSESLLFDV